MGNISNSRLAIFKFNYFQYMIHVYAGYVNGNLVCSRNDYWFFYAYNQILFGVSGFIAFNSNLLEIKILFGIICTLCGIANFLAMIGRIRDTGRSGWFILLLLVPVVGIPVILYFLIDKGKPGKNPGQSHSSNNNIVTPSKVYDDTHVDSIDYAKLANKIFDISLELSGLAKDDLVKNGAFYLDPSTIQTSSMYGTGLYEYSMLLLRERMRKIYTDKHTFEAEDNKMVEVFANKLMVPSTALLKIIDRNGGVKSWEKMLLQDDSVPMDEYINEVKVEVNRATRDLIMGKTDTGLVKTDDPVVSKPKDDTPEDDFDDGL